MDYQTLQEKIGAEMDIPNDWQKALLIESDDSFHIQLVYGYVLSNGTVITSSDEIPHAEDFVHALELLKSRGAERGADYLLCTFVRREDSRLVSVIHTLNSFLCDDDFPDVSVQK